MALDKALPPGTHDLAIRTTSKDGATSALSDQRVAVQVPEAGSKDVLVVLNSPDAASRVIEVPPAPKPPEGNVAAAEPNAPKPSSPPPAVSTPAEPAAKAEPPATPPPPAAKEPQVAVAPPVAPPPPAPPAPAPPAAPQASVTVAAVEADTAGGLYIAGTATSGESVRVYLDDAMIGEAKPSPAGTWLLQIRREVPPGTYRIRADQIGDANGQVIARAEVPFEREINVASLKATGAAGAASGADVSGKMPEVETVIIKRGDNLWRIARNAWGRGIRWSVIYQANRDQIRNPRMIYPGQVFLMPKVDLNASN
jgi:nucleoid-associated protein YgaU